MYHMTSITWKQKELCHFHIDQRNVSVMSLSLPMMDLETTFQ